MKESIPFVSLCWIYYNSMHKRTYIEESLKSLLELDYPRDKYEVIIVDNGSTDEGKEYLKEFIEDHSSDANLRLFRLEKNTGYEGGANFAFKHRDPQAKYFGIVNNDAKLDPSYLKITTRQLEEDSKIGAIQPILLSWDNPSKIDSSGGMLTDYLRIYQLHMLKKLEDSGELYPVTYVEGTAPIYRISAVIAAHNNNVLFIPSCFAYWLEDLFLGILLWNKGYKSLTLSTFLGLHYRYLVSKESTKEVSENLFNYFAFRNRTAFILLTNPREKVILLSLSVLGVLSYGSLSWFLSESVLKKRVKAIIDGINLGRELLKKYGKLDLYKAPIIREKPFKALGEGLWFAGADIISKMKRGRNALNYDIVFIKESIPLSYQGGGERWLLAVAKGLLEKGYSVCIAELVDNEQYVDESLEVINFGSSPIRSVKRVFKELKTEKYYYMPVYAHFVISILKHFRGNIIIGHHNPWLLESRNMYDRIARKFLKRAALNHCLNKYHEEIVKSMGGRTVVLPNKFSFLNPSLKRNWKKAENFTAIFVGRLAREKGADILPKIIRRCNSDITIKIIGEGPLRSVLQKELAGFKNAEVLGRVPDDRLIEEYKRAHVLILPSRYEGSPLVINEAFSFGCAVIASDLPSIRGDLSARSPRISKAAFLVPSEDVEGFVSKLLELKHIWESGEWKEVEDEALSLVEPLSEYVKEFQHKVLHLVGDRGSYNEYSSKGLVCEVFFSP